MKVEGFGNIQKTNIKTHKKKNIGSNSDFESMLGNDINESQNTASSSPVFSSSPLLSMQNNYDQESNNKNIAKDNVNKMIDFMENIRNNITLGQLDKHDLKSLNEIVNRTRENFIDQKLNSILDEVELRASVELAKAEKSAIA